MRTTLKWKKKLQIVVITESNEFDNILIIFILEIEHNLVDPLSMPLYTRFFSTKPLLIRRRLIPQS